MITIESMVRVGKTEGNCLHSPEASAKRTNIAHRTSARRPAV
jgi:hypothetical protein